MKNHFLRFSLLIIVFSALFATACEAGEITEGVTISVNKTAGRKGTTRFAYTVSNTSGSDVTDITIGFEHLTGTAELTIPPFHWSFGKKLSPAIVKSPKGWSKTLITTEESPFMQLSWSIKPRIKGIVSGTTKTGFSVLILGQDTKYETGHWRATLADGTVRVGVLQ